MPLTLRALTDVIYWQDGRPCANEPITIELLSEPMVVTHDDSAALSVAPRRQSLTTAADGSWSAPCVCPDTNPLHQFLWQVTRPSGRTIRFRMGYGAEPAQLRDLIADQCVTLPAESA